MTFSWTGCWADSDKDLPLLPQGDGPGTGRGRAPSQCLLWGGASERGYQGCGPSELPPPRPAPGNDHGLRLYVYVALLHLDLHRNPERRAA